MHTEAFERTVVAVEQAVDDRLGQVDRRIDLAVDHRQRGIIAHERVVECMNAPVEQPDGTTRASSPPYRSARSAAKASAQIVSSDPPVGPNDRQPEPSAGAYTSTARSLV